MEFLTLIYNPGITYEPEELYRQLGLLTDELDEEVNKEIEKLEERREVLSNDIAKSNGCKKSAKQSAPTGQAICHEEKVHIKAIKDDAIPFAPMACKKSAKHRLNKMMLIPEKKQLIDGTGRHKFIFLFYCHARLAYTRNKAEKLAYELNAKFEEPLTDKEFHHQIERVDEHYESPEWKVHGHGTYIFGIDKFLEFLPISEEEAKEMGFTKSRDKIKRSEENQKEADERDRKIASLWLEWKQVEEIRQLLKDKYTHVSESTIKRTIARLGLDKNRDVRLEDIDFEANKRYKRKNTEIKNKEIISLESVNFPQKQEEEGERRKVWDVLLSSKDCFLSGAAGTGKTTLLMDYVRKMRSDGKKVLLLAPSGCAASNIRGCTIHSGLSIPVMDTYVDIPQWNRYNLHVLANIDCVVIDEIGMVRVDLFSYIRNMICAAEKMYKKRIKLVCCGDFLQLSPVISNIDIPTMGSIYAFGNLSDIIWQNTIKLTHVWRQENLSYIMSLNQIASCNLEGLSYINNNAKIGIGQKEMIDCLENGYVYLGAYREDIAKINNLVIQRHKKDQTYKEWGARKQVVYEGMRVMMNKNTKCYTNGSCGTIRKICEKYIVVELKDKIVNVYPKVVDECGIKQLPIQPAYAMTIHKSQGLTLHKVILNPRCFEAGQLYTALSRVRCIDDLTLTTRIRKQDVIVSPDVMEFISKIG